MDKKVEEEFSEMVCNLMQIEFCPDWDPKLLHGFIGISSESAEILDKYMCSMEIGNESLERTGMLIELSDLLHFMQMIVGVLESSFSEIKRDYFYPNPESSKQFYDYLVMTQQCERLDPILLRGFIGISSMSGELLNRYKKFLYYHGEPFTRDAILIGLAKLLFYIQMILDRFDSSIEEIMYINMAKLKSRYPGGYSHDKAITGNRNIEAEKAAVKKVVDSFVKKDNTKR